MSFLRYKLTNRYIIILSEMFGYILDSEAYKTCPEPHIEAGRV